MFLDKKKNTFFSFMVGYFTMSDIIRLGTGPKIHSKNKQFQIDDLSLIDEPDSFIHKPERLSQLPYPIEDILREPGFEHDDVVCALPIEGWGERRDIVDYVETRKNG